MLDSKWSYCYVQALRVGLAIQEMGFYWHEGPLEDDDLYNWAKLHVTPAVRNCEFFELILSNRS